MIPSMRFGAQGWNYGAWVGPFYPLGTRPSDFLKVYSRAFDTVEVDSTFYAIPAASTVRGWAARVPADFVFALKMPQEITHVCRFATESPIFFSHFRTVASIMLSPILGITTSTFAIFSSLNFFCAPKLGKNLTTCPQRVFPYSQLL